jgi:hypothetical protein
MSDLTLLDDFTHKPPHTHGIVVFNIPAEISESEVYATLSRYGRLDGKSRRTREKKGQETPPETYGFKAVYLTRASARAARQALNGAKVWAHQKQRLVAQDARYKGNYRGLMAFRGCVGFLNEVATLRWSNTITAITMPTRTSNGDGKPLAQQSNGSSSSTSSGTLGSFAFSNSNNTTTTSKPFHEMGGEMVLAKTVLSGLNSDAFMKKKAPGQAVVDDDSLYDAPAKRGLGGSMSRFGDDGRSGGSGGSHHGGGSGGAGASANNKG